jgi:hypothetical protein
MSGTSQHSTRSRRQNDDAVSNRSKFSNVSRSSKVSHKLPDRFEELYKPSNQKQAKKPRPSSSHGFMLSSNNLTLKKYAELGQMMEGGINLLKEEVNRLNVDDFIMGKRLMSGKLNHS